jgi:hypothetical protein
MGLVQQRGRTLSAEFGHGNPPTTPSPVVGRPTYSLPAKNLRALEYIASKIGGLEGDELHRLQELYQVA